MTATGWKPRYTPEQMWKRLVRKVAMGAVLGLVLAHWGNRLMGREINQSGELTLGLNWRVMGFAFGASTLSGFAVGLVPAWLASRASAHEAMKQGGRG